MLSFCSIFFFLWRDKWGEDMFNRATSQQVLGVDLQISRDMKAKQSVNHTPRPGVDTVCPQKFSQKSGVTITFSHPESHECCF